MPTPISTSYNTCRAIIDLAALRFNLAQVKNAVGNSQVMAVIKADAYGHGLVAVAKALSPHVQGMAVARLKEALELRKHGINNRLLLLGSLIDEQELKACAEHNIDIVIHSTDGVQRLLQTPLTRAVNVWLKVDVGMHRLGLSPEQLVDSYHQLSESNNAASLVLMCHFSSADDESPVTGQQLNNFDDITRAFDSQRSAANSAAILTQPSSHYDWVRPGIVLYGANPVPDYCNVELKPVMTLKAKVIAIRELEPDRGVGYNHRWISSRHTRLATVAIGYADGYPRHAKDGTPVLVNGQYAKLAGRVSMDLITVDISDCGTVDIGDEVTLWGQGLPAEQVAAYADTISYQLFTSTAGRVCKHYINEQS